jgi:DNA (cytosine-5)-methyltransferase 1
MYNADISKLDPNQLLKRHGRVDVIVGGPPCQGFSQKGKRLSVNDDRNFLFRQYVRFVEVFRPKFFVIENVPNIITTANGYFKDEIIKAFSALGYDVKADVFDVSEYGVPQQRRRAVFIGQLERNNVAFPRPTGKRVTVNDAISDMTPLESGEGVDITPYLTPPANEYQRKMRKGMRGGVKNHQATAHSAIAITRMKMIPKGMGKEVLPPEHRTKSIYSGTWCRLIEDDIAATITTRFDTPSSGRFTHPTQNRCITVREAARRTR